MSWCSPLKKISLFTWSSSSPFCASIACPSICYEMYLFQKICLYCKVLVLQILLLCHVMAYHVCHVIYPSLSFIKYKWFSFISKLTWIFSFTLLIVHYNSHAEVFWIWPSNLVNKEKIILYNLMYMIYFRPNGWDEPALKT